MTVCVGYQYSYVISHCSVCHSNSTKSQGRLASWFFFVSATDLLCNVCWCIYCQWEAENVSSRYCNDAGT